jgi:two-component system, LytTR family, sensor kinase
MQRAVRQRLLWGAGIFLVWTVLALVFVPQQYLRNQGAPIPITWAQSTLSQLLTFWTWALLTPAVIWFGRRFPVDKRHTARHLLLYFAGAFAFAQAHMVLLTSSQMLLGFVMSGRFRSFPSMERLWLSYGAMNVLICLGILAASQALIYNRRYQERELHLAQTQLQALRTQLHPHFLFNTLNATAELIYRDTAAAERTITQLSELLRTTLNRVNVEEVPFQEELEFMRNYVAIQQTLMQERLRVVWEVADDALDAAVPGMLLQPLVENAIRHGIGPRASGGTIWIRAAVRAEQLRLEVHDNGSGTTPAGRSAGIGRSNTRARLSHLYGDRFSLELTPRAGGGTVATVTIPLRRL